eukprot:CAMPEP_0174362014 /NCGR_PEP_ID=MMETSP0811_2-20130205/62155_1 /TAXON_ID=73025 ORGANISM="Eutreptiella gymnastica-like, Strain CCMP1594" /NCGR_SAMPLE_ID=MMETSP0811_2 /ASSEMBLY_ACC=CAM_ASM_000667 /LENGTH=66 /DNA_ID=CAMNT_0015499223 /DNA_START=30 /DNA_END=227 /DNA_ORIENTATION=+
MVLQEALGVALGAANGSRPKTSVSQSILTAEPLQICSNGCTAMHSPGPTLPELPSVSGTARAPLSP